MSPSARYSGASSKGYRAGKGHVSRQPKMLGHFLIVLDVGKAHDKAKGPRLVVA